MSDSKKNRTFAAENQYVMDIKQILQDQKAEIIRFNPTILCTRTEEKLFDLQSDLAQVVIGVRRSGKSTLCLKVLKESGMSFGYVNFDDEQLAGLKVSQLNDVLDALYKVYGDITHVLFDEIQNVDHWPLFVNRLLRQGLHVVMTGSNANLLSGELATHLTGRYNQIELFPFSFLEYCAMRKIDIQTETTRAHALRYAALEEYLQQGGFPELLKLKNKYTYTLSLFKAIIHKDISKRYKVKHEKTLADIANTMLDLFCQEISYGDIQKQFELGSAHTAKKYIHYLQEAYLFRLLPIYTFKSTEKQSSRKCYAIDAAFITNHEDFLQTPNLGWRLENMVAIELMRRMNSEIEQLFYLRKHKNFEVDFVRTNMGHVEELIQVTYNFVEPNTKLYNREIGGLIKGAKLTHCNHLTLIMMDGEEREIEQDGFVVKCVRATNWLLNNNK